MKCNLCDNEIDVSGSCSTILHHLKDTHKDIHDLHRDNPNATVGFRVQFLQMDELKEGEQQLLEGDNIEPVILGEVCETLDAEVAEVTTQEESDVVNMQYVMMGTKKRQPKTESKDQRKRSWIWKYFERLSNIIYCCNLCKAVLSTKGSNTNNLNRHMKSKHPDTYKVEKFGEVMGKDSILEVDGEQTPYVIKEEVFLSDTPSQKARRSWIWSYFEFVSSTQAQCKLCHRLINHGGNATGNMNRHLKTIHHKTDRDHQELSWIWKVFMNEAKHYVCKICQQKIVREKNSVDVINIREHLKKEHGVVSGDQIITGSECELGEND